METLVMLVVLINLTRDMKSNGSEVSQILNYHFTSYK